MRIHHRKWALAALLVVTADAALVLTAGLFLEASSHVHASITVLVAGMLSGIASIVPAGVVAGVGAILGALGAGWWQEHLVAPALSGGTGAGTPALAGILAVPVYTAVRRAGNRPEKEPAPRAGAPVHRIYVARTAVVPGPRPIPVGPAATA